MSLTSTSPKNLCFHARNIVTVHGQLLIFPGAEFFGAQMAVTTTDE